MISAVDKEIQALIGDIRDGRLLLPELQRRYVWKATQVRNLFDSLYHQYPSGQLLIWQTDDLPFSRTASVDAVEKSAHQPQLLLDGQQRLTSLAAVMLGQPLSVSGRKRPIDIAFNLFTERFEVAGPRQRGQTGWISLSKLFTKGAMAILMELKLDPASPEAQQVYERLTRLDNIKGYKYRVNVLEKLDYSTVTDIFVRINSGGTTLGSADLALAQVSSRWRGVTEEFEAYQQRVRQHRLELDSGLLLRAQAVLFTSQTRLGQLFRGDRQHTTVEELQAAWKRVQRGMDQAISFLIQNCRIERLDLLPTKSVLVPLVAFFDRFGTNVSPAQARELQRWVYMALIWTRYSTMSETAIDQDVAALGKDQPVEAMIRNIEDQVGRRPVTEHQLDGQRKDSPFMLMAYVLARQAGAQDWFNGVEIGASQILEYHHIFPKALLRDHYDLKEDSRTVDQVANLVFLSARANARIAHRDPAQYLPEIDPQRLRAQCVPTDPALWNLERFEDFLRARRTVLADAINRLLLSLTEKPSLWPVSDAQLLETRVDVIERTLRRLASERLMDAWGESAWEHSVPKDVRNSVDHRLKQRLASNPFETGQFESLESKLDLCQFSDYLKIIRDGANWPLFEEVFGNAGRLEQHFKAATDARNAIKHGRAMNRSELASGEAGLLWLEDCLNSARATLGEAEPAGEDT